MKLSNPPRVVVFAGPNGAGKSTHADAILAALGMKTFVNADYIARGLSGRHTDAVAFEAGRIMLRRLHQLGDAGADFAFESTLLLRPDLIPAREPKLSEVEYGVASRSNCGGANA